MRLEHEYEFLLRGRDTLFVNKQLLSFVLENVQKNVNLTFSVPFLHGLAKKIAN